MSIAATLGRPRDVQKFVAPDSRMISRQTDRTAWAARPWWRAPSGCSFAGSVREDELDALEKVRRTIGDDRAAGSSPSPVAWLRLVPQRSPKRQLRRASRFQRRSPPGRREAPSSHSQARPASWVLSTLHSSANTALPKPSRAASHVWTVPGLSECAAKCPEPCAWLRSALRVLACCGLVLPPLSVVVTGKPFRPASCRRCSSNVAPRRDSCGEEPILR